MTNLCVTSYYILVHKSLKLSNQKNFGNTACETCKFFSRKEKITCAIFLYIYYFFLNNESSLVGSICI